MKSKKVKKTVEIEDDELDLKKAKVKTTLYLDGDVWDALHERAEQEDRPYQSLTNILLRRILLGEPNPIEDRLRKLEEAVFKSRAG